MNPATPTASIIIPAYHSYRTIAACLTSLRCQTVRDFEVIVVNSSPEEKTAELVTTGFPAVRFIQSTERLLPHAARNRGVEESSGNLLIFTDPDCTFPPNWLSALLDAHRDGHSVVGGSMGLQQTTWYEEGLHLCKFHWSLPGRPAGKAWILPTANALYSRRAWQAAGPFDGDFFCSDATLSWRVAAAGHPPWFAPDAVVLHHHGDGLTAFWGVRRRRGEEFARARVAFEGWSRPRLLSALLLSPVLPFVVLVQAGRDALQSSWTGPYLWTLPIQLLGHIGWSLGEARAHLALLRSGKSDNQAAP